MKKWPEFDDNGDLPTGIHQATLAEVLQHFGTGSIQRHLVGQRLARIYKLAKIPGRWQDLSCLAPLLQPNTTPVM